MTGCTFGKGNLIHLDYGKNAFTFIRRSDNKAVRIVTKPDGWGPPDPEREALLKKLGTPEATEADRARYQEIQAQRTKILMERPLEDIFDICRVEPIVPARARIHNSVTCAGCGESVMETRSRVFRGEPFCIPCFEARDRRY